MAATIEALEIKIGENSSSAVDGIKRLTDALKGLKTVIGADGAGLTAVASAMKTAAEAMIQVKTVTKQTKDAAENATSGLKGLNEAAKNTAVDIGGSNKSLEKFNQVTKQISLPKNVVGGLSSSFKEIKASLEDVTNGFKKFFKSIGRIALYRAIRSAIKAVSDAIKTGITNLYQWSKITGGEFAQSMDKAATALQYYKNSVATVFAPIIESLVPILDNLIDKIVEANNYIAMFFAYLQGKTTYDKAIKSTTVYAKAVSTLNKQLMKFDELNNITTTKASQNTPDYSSMFETSPVGNITSSLALTIKDVLFDWGSNMTKEDIAEKIMTGIFGVAGALIGWKIGGVGGALVGLTLGASLGMKLASLTFDHDGKISEKEIKKLIMTAAFGVAGAIIGWSVTKTVAGAAVGFSLGATLGIALSNATFTSNVGLTKTKVGTMIMSALFGAAGAIIGWSIAGTKGAVVGLSLGASLGMAVSSMKWSSSQTKKTMLTGLCSALTAGSAAAIAFKVLGAAGGASTAVIGATIALMLMPTVTKIAWSTDKTDWGFTQLAKDFKKAWDSFWDKQTFTSYITGDWASAFESSKNKFGSLVEGLKNFFTLKADGGYVSQGQLFVAREAGPEMVGTIGGKTAVANNDQITSAIASAVYSAMMSANSQSSTNVTITGDMSRFLRAVKQSNYEASLRGV